MPFGPASWVAFYPVTSVRAEQHGSHLRRPVRSIGQRADYATGEGPLNRVIALLDGITGRADQLDLGGALERPAVGIVASQLDAIEIDRALAGQGRIDQSVDGEHAALNARHDLIEIVD